MEILWDMPFVASAEQVLAFHVKRHFQHLQQFLKAPPPPSKKN